VDIEASVALRMRRQSVINREESPAQLWWVVEEQALRRPIGGAGVTASQLDHLLEMTKRPDINVQVIPQEVGVHPSLKGAFFLLRFEDDWRVAYEETRRFAYYYDSPDAVEDYGKVMNHLRHLALNPKRSRALIAKVRKEFLSARVALVDRRCVQLLHDGLPPRLPTGRVGSARGHVGHGDREAG
jgi:Domain of unknown function (DUF5753)